MNTNRHRAALFATLLLTCAVGSAPAFANQKPAADKTLSPYFFIAGGDPSVDQLPLQKTAVAIDIAGVIANVTVEQTYKNEGTRPINARYVFPASTRAAVHGMTMTIGDHVIEAKIAEREKARKTFEKAKREGKTASLLEEHRPNVFSMEVGNIMPGDVVEVKLRYTELIVPTDGTYELVYPTVVGPRYAGVPESQATDRDRFVESPYRRAGKKPAHQFTIEARIKSGIPLSSLTVPSHDVNVAWTARKRARIVLDKSEVDGANRDFILRYRLAGGKIQSGLLLHRGERENFFLLMMEPPERVEASEIPPREYVFIVDVSGSMSGFPLDTSKELLKNLVGSLRPTDTFNVILFAGSAHLMSPSSMPATTQNVAHALQVLSNQRGGGGTNVLAAVQQAMALPADGVRSRSFVVITDGYIYAEKSVFDYIRQHLGEANVFAFGIGSSVNRFLIEGIAKAGMGAPFVVTDPTHAAKTAARFKTYIESPVLTDIDVRYAGFDVYDVEPVAIPDLLAERPLVVFGKWKGDANGTIRVSGVTGNGRFAKTVNVSEAAGDTNPALGYLWARKRIAMLSDFNIGPITDEDKATVTKLGLSYNLLTPYTSFVAVHQVVRNADGSATDVAQPLALPRGVPESAVGMAAGSEPGLAILVAMLGVFGVVWWSVTRRQRRASR